MPYYGYRYFSPELGRWLNRDPIRERGGVNLYVAIRNSSANKIDPFGLMASPTQPIEPPPLVGWPDDPKIGPPHHGTVIHGPESCPEGQHRIKTEHNDTFVLMWTAPIADGQYDFSGGMNENPTWWYWYKSEETWTCMECLCDHVPTITLTDRTVSGSIKVFLPPAIMEAYSIINDSFTWQCMFPGIGDIIIIY